MAIVWVSLSRSRGLRLLICEWKMGKWPHMSCKEEHSVEQLSDNSWCSGISSNNNNLIACLFSQALKKRGGENQVLRQLWHSLWFYLKKVEIKMKSSVIVLRSCWGWQCGSGVCCFQITELSFPVPDCSIRLTSNMSIWMSMDDERPPRHKIEILTPEDTQCWLQGLC